MLSIPGKTNESDHKNHAILKKQKDTKSAFLRNAKAHRIFLAEMKVYQKFGKCERHRNFVRVPFCDPILSKVLCRAVLLTRLQPELFKEQSKSKMGLAKIFRFKRALKMLFVIEKKTEPSY